MVNLLLKLFVKDYENTSSKKVCENYELLGSFFGLISNALLFILKIIIGLFLGMYSLIADSINNLSDFGNSLLGIIGAKIANKKADSDHPYGHQRVEYIISLIISMVIIFLGVILAYQGIVDLIAFISSMLNSGKPVSYNRENDSFFIITLILLIVAIFIKLLQSYVYFSLGKKISSLPLKALGRDSLNDVLSTSLVIVSLLISYFSNYVFDFIFTLIVSILVILSGISILKESISPLISQTPDKELVHKLISLIKNHEGILGMHDLSFHLYGRDIYALCHVEVDGKSDIMSTHELIDDIEREAYKDLNVKLTLHMDPILKDDNVTLKYKEEIVKTINLLNLKGFKIHDFRVIRNSDCDKLFFDIIIPNAIDDEKHQSEILNKLKEAANKTFNKKTILNVSFDDSTSDLLED